MKPRIGYFLFILVFEFGFLGLKAVQAKDDASPLLLKANFDFETTATPQSHKQLDRFLLQLKESSPDLKIEFHPTKDEDVFEYVVTKQHFNDASASAFEADKELFRIFITPPYNIRVKTPPLPPADLNKGVQLINPILKRLEGLPLSKGKTARVRKSLSVSLSAFEGNQQSF